MLFTNEPHTCPMPPLYPPINTADTEYSKYTPRGTCRRCGLPRDMSCNCDAPQRPDEAKPANRCAEVLTKAFELTGGDRANTHGDKRQNHQNIADLWNAYLGGNADGGKLARPLTPQDVAILMCLLKIARMKSGTFNLDNFIDLAGYAGVAAECSDDP